MGSRSPAAVGFVLAALVTTAACASMPEDPIERQVYLEANDPLEPMNRAILAFNLGFDQAVLEPAVRGYRAAMPPAGRAAISRFLANLGEPITFVNDVLQLEFGRAVDTLIRFGVNSTVGLAGFFDVVPIEPHEEDFGQTLGRYGVGEGAYLVLPVLGPSSLRASAGMVGDALLDPWSVLLDPTQRQAFSLQRRTAGGIADRERLTEDLARLRATSVDMYATLRSLYRQNRASEIRNGAPAPFEFEFEFD